MKIYNQEKTQELNESELDFEKGRLQADKLLIAHHEATSFKKGRSAKEVADELKSQGVEVEESFLGYFRVIKEYEGGGRETAPIEDEPDTPAKEAWDEEEDIQVFVPYTEEEIEERRLNALRSRRALLLEAFDKWEKAVLRGREKDDKSVMDWYLSILNLEKESFEKIPNRVGYYL